MRRSQSSMGNPLFTWLLLAMAANVFVFMFVLTFIVAAIAFLFIRQKFLELTSIEFAPTRLFDAPPETRWISAYEFWMYQLHRITGIEFHTSPGRLLIGSLLISEGGALVTGIVLLFLDPISGGHWFALVLGIGAVVGILTGVQMGQPAEGWLQRFSGDEPDWENDEQGDVQNLGSVSDIIEEINDLW